MATTSGKKASDTALQELEIDAAEIGRWKNKPLHEVNDFLRKAGINPQPTIDEVLELVKEADADWKHRRKAK